MNLFDQLVAPRDRETLFMERPGGLRETYGDLIDHTGRLAQVLVALGVRPGDRVAAQVEKSPEALHLYLAVLRVGAVYLPLNAGYTLMELAYFARNAEPTLIVCDPADQEAVTELAETVGARVATLDTQAGGSLMSFARRQDHVAFDTVPRGPDDLAAILYTSGTTGRSKGAMLTHANLVSNAETLAALWRFTPADVLIHALPIYHIHGLFVASNTVLAAGASMIFRPRFDPEEVIGLMSRASVLMGVPTYYSRLLAREALTPEAAASMRLFVSGSAPLLAETHRQWAARTGHQILERYGMTETGMNASNPYEGERRAGTVGFPLPGVEIRIAGEADAPPKDGIGMIEVRGPNVCAGYWRAPDRTAQDFREDGWFITGDLGTLDPDGYLSIVGRAKDLVISGGLNVYPKEVEDLIDALPGVVECAVIGLPHPDLGEAVTAVAVAGEGAPSEAELIAALAGRLARFKQPKRVVFVADLPRNAMGKVQKARLRELYVDLYR